jgi:flagellar biosynthesis protein FlhA
LIVTRSGAKGELGEAMSIQIISQPTGLFVTAGFLMLLALTPLPTMPLLATAAVLMLLGVMLVRGKTQRAAAVVAQTQHAQQVKAEAPAPETFLKLDTMELEIGFGLVTLVDTTRGGDLLDRISAIRRQLAGELGIIMPPIRIRDNLQLQPNDYRIKIKGAVVARGTTITGKLLAIDSGISTGPIEGMPGKEPAFGLDAYWIEPTLKTKAETLNYTVVDPVSVLATHLTETARTHAADLLSRQEVSELVGQLKVKSPKLVEEAMAGAVRTADLHRVLQNLLRERVPIRDTETILETLADWIGKTKDLDVLTEYVRNALRRAICQQHATTGETGRPRIVCCTLDPGLEDQINAYIDRSAAGTSLTMPAGVAQRVSDQITRGLQQVTAGGHTPIVIASPTVRAVVRQIIEQGAPGAVVLGYNEIVPGVDAESVALVPALSTGEAARSPQAAA